MRTLFGLGIAGVVSSLVLASCSSPTLPGPVANEGPMAGVEVVVGGTPEPTDQIMSALMVLALEDRGADVVDRSNTADTALNRDDLVAGRLQVVPEDIGTGWFVHLGQTETFRRTTELSAELHRLDGANGIEWSDHSSFDDALAAIADADAASDDAGEPITISQLASRLANSFDAVVCVDQETLQSPDGLVRFEQATGFTVPAEQLEIRPAAQLIDAVESGECTIGFVPGLDHRIEEAGLVTINRFAPEGLAEVVFVPRNAAYMFNSDFYEDWSEWIGPYLETLMVTLDADAMVELKAALANGDPVLEIARRHLERNDLL